MSVTNKRGAAFYVAWTILQTAILLKWVLVSSYMGDASAEVNRLLAMKMSLPIILLGMIGFLLLKKNKQKVFQWMFIGYCVSEIIVLGSMVWGFQQATVLPRHISWMISIFVFCLLLHKNSQLVGNRAGQLADWWCGGGLILCYVGICSWYRWYYFPWHLLIMRYGDLWAILLGRLALTGTGILLCGILNVVVFLYADKKIEDNTKKEHKKEAA